MTCVSPWYDRHGWLGIDSSHRFLQCGLSDLICLWFDHWLSLWFDDLCFALIWPSRSTGRSPSVMNQMIPAVGYRPVSSPVTCWLVFRHDLTLVPRRRRTIPTTLSTDVRARSCQLWAVRVCTETKLDEACRWLPLSEHAESRKQRKPSPTHDNRHLPSLSGALDVSGAAL